MATLFLPTVGHAYKFTFDARFSTADGVYKVDRIYTYDEYVADGRNIGEDFYSPCGLKAEDANSDYNTLKDSLFLKVSAPDPSRTSPIEYFPLCYVVTTPDHNIKKYNKFGLIVYAGITENIQNFEYLRKNVEQLFNSCLGIESDPYWVAISSQWMTEEEYAQQLQHQNISKNKVLNYYSENIRLQRENSSLTTRVTSYEEVIIRQQRDIDDLKAQLEQAKGTV